MESEAADSGRENNKYGTDLTRSIFGDDDYNFRSHRVRATCDFGLVPIEYLLAPKHNPCELDPHRSRRTMREAARVVRY